MQIGVLGPLRAGLDGHEVAIAGGRLRTLLTALAVAAPQPVGSDALAAALWGDDLPTDVPNALQSLVSRLRRALGDASLVRQSAGGYALLVAAADVDLQVFGELVRSAREALTAGDATGAERCAVAALALWRGDPGPDVESLAPHAGELHVAVRADLARAQLRLGRPAEAVIDLERLVAAHPLREDLVELAVRALAADGRPAAALAAYERAREVLAEALGVDPSEGLRALHLELLRGGLAPAPGPSRARSSLPAALTTFLGRTPQLERLADLFVAGRLVTLVGPGGAGKTRLSVEYGRSLSGPVWLAELAPVVHPSDVPQAVLDGLGLRDATLMDRTGGRAPGPRDATDRLADALADRGALLVLDNCEHVLDAAAELATSLLAGCADLRILATSREALGVLGEALVPVPPLDPEGAALQLFCDRAAAVDPAFADGLPADPDDAAAVVEIARRLDGLPLALELAAAQLRSLRVTEVAARLSDRFRLLAGGNRAAVPRHRTLRAVVAWSWELLTPDERLLAERLAVFSGGVSVPAAAAVHGVDERAVDPLLAGLLDKSLLTRVPGPERRYRMLETIREYGAEQLADRGELTSVRAAHAAWCAALAHELEPVLRSAAQLGAIDRLAAEHAELVTAVAFLAATGEVQAALQMVADLAWFWSITGRQSETVTWARIVLAAAEEPGAQVNEVTGLTVEAYLTVNALAWDADDAGGTRMAARMANLAQLNARMAVVDATSSPLLTLLRPLIAMFVGDTERMAPLFEVAMASTDPWVRAVARSFRAGQAENDGDTAGMRADATLAYAELAVLGERWGQANALQMLAALDVMDGELASAEERFRAVLALTGELGAVEDELRLRLGLADVLMRQGRSEDARRELTAADDARGERGSLESMFTDIMQADILRTEGRLDVARPQLRAVLDRIDALPDIFPMKRHGLALSLSVAGRIALAEGDTGAARRDLARAYTAGVGSRDMPVLAHVGVVIAAYALAVDKPVDAAEILGAAAALRGSEDATSLDIAALTARLRELPGTPLAYAAGRALTRDEALARLDPARCDPH